MDDNDREIRDRGTTPSERSVNETEVVNKRPQRFKKKNNKKRQIVLMSCELLGEDRKFKGEGCPGVGYKGHQYFAKYTHVKGLLHLYVKPEKMMG